VAAVTEPTRRQMLDLLPITRQAVSKHLAVLERAELVERRRELLYRVNVEQFDRATRSLSDLADVWDKRLARIKRLAEAVAKSRRA
jgi:DNA-binding transcriptional ArsR family regulator